MKTNKQLRKQQASQSEAKIKAVFDGTGAHQDPLAGCADECVGGTANTKAMQKTNPKG